MLIISGKAGVGKSRLAQEFGRWFAPKDFTTPESSIKGTSRDVVWGEICVDIVRTS